ncbi:aspartate 1-decarboxylase [Temperatibacter marinus]|uniref:Aspartate 1-decarboxylase n=1 Tax=Temperatibacter marinus TaxID=1456591 RepID=A0AA52EAG4_9PROT|nr:aspartate 1-decarboxylase [Temperatibacter marinus]WND01697.1 aspartate 1-decarboxylase [Temperatibacter marinus]
MSLPLDSALRPFMYGKLHRVTVTGAELDYVGSITVDPVLLRASGLLPHTQVDVVNITNGERIQTYIIEGTEGSGVICLNGAAAHQFSKGDLAIIMGYEMVAADQLPGRISRAVHVDSNNKIVGKDEYRTPAFSELGKPEANREGEIYETVKGEGG